MVEAGVIGGDAGVPVVLDRIMQKEIRILGARSKGYQAVASAMSIAESGKYPLDQIVTREYPLADAAKALQIAAGETGERPLKVTLKP